MYLLDSDTVIDVMRDHSPVPRRLAAISPDDVWISAITVAELWVGVHMTGFAAQRLAATENFLRQTKVLSFDGIAAREYARIRVATRSRPIGVHDAQIASIALARDLLLVSSNLGEFTRVPGLRVESWR